MLDRDEGVVKNTEKYGWTEAEGCAIINIILAQQAGEWSRLF